MKHIIHFLIRWLGTCLAIFLLFLLGPAPAAAQDDSGPQPVLPAADGQIYLLPDDDEEVGERNEKVSILPLVVDPHPGQFILPSPGPAVPQYLPSPFLEPPTGLLENPQDPTLLPDLIVEDIWSTTNPLQAGQDENVTFMIKNQGTGAVSTTFYINLIVDGVVKAAWSSGGLLAGQKAQASTTIQVSSSGLHEIKMIVDYSGLIAESNESNNMHLENWNWGTSPVDLVVTDIWSTTNPLQAGQIENVIFRIQNQGTAVAPQEFQARLTVDGRPIATWTYSSLGAGAVGLATFNNLLLNDKGAHEVAVTVDFGENAPEYDEMNNTRVEHWTWGASPVDLLVSDIWSTTNPLRAGETDNVTFTIKNEGTGPVPVNFHAHLWLDGLDAGYVLISGLDAGATAVKELDIKVETPGLHEIKVGVDEGANVPEFNEDNNSRIENWHWENRPVDLVVTDIWSSTEPLQAGMVENVHFQVKNEGPLGTPTTFFIRFYVDGAPVGEAELPGLDAGATATSGREIQLNDPGAHEMKVIVDYTDLVVETNEGNNEYVENWNWDSNPVDLVVDDVWLTTEPLEAGSEETMQVRIHNLGTEEAVGLIHTRVWVDGTTVGTVQTNGLAAGATAVKALNIQVNDPGVHEVRVMVDHTGEIFEGDESNNEWVGSWEWTAVPEPYMICMPLVLE